MTRALAMMFAVAVLVTPGIAHAEDLRVVLVEPGPTLERAATLVLEPRGIDLEAIAEPNPGATMPAAQARGRALSDAHHATAVVWVSAGEDGFALWVYDRRTDRVAARALSAGPPFDAPTAAQLALTVQTLLFAVAPSLPSAPRDEAPSEPDVEANHIDSDRWALLLGGGVRVLATTPFDVDARFHLALTFWPAALERILGVTLDVVSGPGLEITGDALRAHWTDSSVLIALRARLALDDVIDFGLALGIGARLTTLDGVASLRNVLVDQLRIDPISRVEVEFGARAAPWLRLELRVGALLPWRVQHYYVDGELALVVSAASLRTSLGFELEFQ